MTNPVTEFVSAAGANLFTRVDGPPDAPWLVLSNSVGADHTMWDAQMASLTRDYRVLRYDTRGHGRSDAPMGPYSFTMLVADVAAIFDHYRIDRAVFVGLSLGGMTGIGFTLAHPSRVERLVCCDARADSPEAFVKGWDDRIAAVRRGGMAAILDGTIERWLTKPFRDAHPDIVARIAAMFIATPPVGYIGCAEALKGLDFLGRMHAISVPTLFVVGAEDSAASLPGDADDVGRRAAVRARRHP